MTGMINTIFAIAITIGLPLFLHILEQHRKAAKLQGRKKNGQFKKKARKVVKAQKIITPKQVFRKVPIKQGDTVLSYITMRG